jgi:hypothetical protein
MAILNHANIEPDLSRRFILRSGWGQKKTPAFRPGLLPAARWSCVVHFEAGAATPTGVEAERIATATGVPADVLVE